MSGDGHDWKAHVPRWVRNLVVALPVISALITSALWAWKAAGDYQQAKIEDRAIPFAVDSLRQAVFGDRIPDRLARLEIRTDSLSVLYGRVDELGDELDAQGARVNRILCLVEVQLGLRANALRCDDAQ